MRLTLHGCNSLGTRQIFALEADSTRVGRDHAPLAVANDGHAFRLMPSSYAGVAGIRMTCLLTPSTDPTKVIAVDSQKGRIALLVQTGTTYDLVWHDSLFCPPLHTPLPSHWVPHGMSFSAASGLGGIALTIHLTSHGPAREYMVWCCLAGIPSHDLHLESRQLKAALPTERGVPLPQRQILAMGSPAGEAFVVGGRHKTLALWHIPNDLPKDTDVLSSCAATFKNSLSGLCKLQRLNDLRFLVGTQRGIQMWTIHPPETQGEGAHMEHLLTASLENREIPRPIAAMCMPKRDDCVWAMDEGGSLWEATFHPPKGRRGHPVWRQSGPRFKQPIFRLTGAKSKTFSLVLSDHDQSLYIANGRTVWLARDADAPPATDTERRSTTEAPPSGSDRIPMDRPNGSPV